MSRPPARAARWLVGALCALGLWASVARAEVPPSLSGEHIVEVALQGEAAGVAVAVALDQNCALRDADVAAIQKRMRAQGADPGDIPSANALVENVAAE